MVTSVPLTFNVYTNPTPPPSPFLGSDTNYYLMANPCADLNIAQLTMDVLEDMVVDNTQGSGFSLQWNLYSPKGFREVWQQYAMGIDVNGLLVTAVNNWNVTTFDVLYDRYFCCYPLKSGAFGYLPAGSRWQIGLLFDSGHNVSGASYSAYLDGNTIASTTISLASIPNFQSTFLAPVLGFQANIVGYANAEASHFTSGSGVLSSTVFPAVQAFDVYPNSSCPSDAYNVITGEKSNMNYGPVTKNTVNYVSQEFFYNPSAAVLQNPDRKKKRNAHAVRQ